MSLAEFSKRAGISIAQLSQFENGKNGLTVEQVQQCRTLLLAAATDRAQRIASLFAREHAAEMAEAAG